MAIDGTRLKIVRTVRGYSQSELAKLISVSPKTVGDWENDNARPTIANEERLKECLNWNKETDYALAIILREGRKYGNQQNDS